MSNITIESNVVMKKINEVKPYVRNPRKNDKTVDLLCKIIPKVGFNVPLVIDEKGVIVKGHARFAAAIRLGMEEIPCIITHADEEAIKADRITDNKISEFSEWVNDEVMHEIDMINFDIDFNDFGFAVPTLDDVPTFDDFNTNTDNSNVSCTNDTAEQVSDDEKRKLYEEFIARKQQEAANVPDVHMTTENAIKAAEQKLYNPATPQRNYFKCVCEKCGHIMFVDAADVWNPEVGLIRGASV